MAIKVLDKETVSRIAAGEVVERPASVVKELVENALDAGASRIMVEVDGGGVSLMRVTDNGKGIPADEVALAFERHATSKISTPDDLQLISSLGFRGEALPSIAVVAWVEIATCAENEPAGTFISLDGGREVSHQRRAMALGTTVTVRDLFRKVPARLKFLKSASTEKGHIANVVSQYALAYPWVSFILSVEGKETLRTSGRGRLLDSIIDVYGVEVAGRMLEVSSRSPDWQSGDGTSLLEVTGMVGAPEVGRSSRSYLSFFVNHRWVNSRLLSRAVEDAYQGLIMAGRHPVAVINITLPPPEVDVNIHPAKSEVKFQDESGVFRAVQRSVRQALTMQMPLPRVENPVVAFAAPHPALRWPDVLKGDATGLRSPVESRLPLVDSVPMLRVVGQVLNSYIVAEGPDGLYLVDQHAAHERVRYETVSRQRSQRNVEVQGLLEPSTLQVTPRQDGMLRECLEELAGFGFSLESFGDRTYLVRTVPSMLTGEAWDEVLLELLDSLSGESKSRQEEAMVASIACHGAVRSGQVLSDDEMRELVRQLEQTSNPHTCPHGRPTIIQLSRRQLEREFGRS